MKLTKIYRDTAKVADVASVANSGSIVIYTHSVKDEETTCDEIIRCVNNHKALVEALRAIEKQLSLKCDATCMTTPDYDAIMAGRAALDSASNATSGDKGFQCRPH